MKRILVYVFTLMFAICLPILSMAETAVKIDREDVIDANELEDIITKSDLEEEITSGLFFGKPNHYNEVWKFVKNNQGSALYKRFRDFLEPEDFVVVWQAGAKTYAEHIFCYAARGNKMDAAESLVLLYQMEEECALGIGDRRNVKYDPNKHHFWNVTHVQELNPKLACYALKQNGFGFTWDSQKDYPLAVKGGCGDVYIKRRHNNFKFPRDYSLFTTGKAWLQLARLQPKLVSDERFQKHLHDYYYNDSADDEVTQKKLKELLIEK